MVEDFQPKTPESKLEYTDQDLEREMGETPVGADPAMKFLQYIDNFYLYFPGGRLRNLAKSFREKNPSNFQPATLGGMQEIEKKAGIIDKIIKELIDENSSINFPEIERIGETSIALSAPGYNLVRKVYIEMRRRGYKHEDLKR